jgi:hypothetical protein
MHLAIKERQIASEYSVIHDRQIAIAQLAIIRPNCQQVISNTRLPHHHCSFSNKRTPNCQQLFSNKRTPHD